VVRSVVLGTLACMMSCMQGVAVCQVRMMGGLFVVSRVVVFGRFTMVMRRVVMVISRDFVMLTALVRRAHGVTPLPCVLGSARDTARVC
jgi:hypothetical protein